MTNEELMQQDLPEILKLWIIIKELKDKGNGELSITVRDRTIVNVKKSFGWVHKGTPFDESIF